MLLSAFQTTMELFFTVSISIRKAEIINQSRALSGDLQGSWRLWCTPTFKKPRMRGSKLPFSDPNLSSVTDHFLNAKAMICGGHASRTHKKHAASKAAKDEVLHCWYNKKVQRQVFLVCRVLTLLPCYCKGPCFKLLVNLDMWVIIFYRWLKLSADFLTFSDSSPASNNNFSCTMVVTFWPIRLIYRCLIKLDTS